jgi:spore maturation protein CgeB
MNLVIFGLTISSSWGNGHATLWRGLCRALAARGHEVIFFERDVPYYAAHRDEARPLGCDLRLYRDWTAIENEAAAALERADVAIVTSYCPDAQPATDLLVERRPQRLVFYDMDTPITLDRLDRGEAVPYLPTQGLGAFDVVLSFTGGRALETLTHRLGARAVAPLYGSVDPGAHHPVPADPSIEFDLTYLGTYAADRQAQLEAFLIEPARQRPDKRFAIAGSMYPVDFPWLPNIYYLAHMPPPDHSRFYCSSGLTLNITRGPMAAMGYCPSGRLFEAAACGTVVLSDWWEGLDAFFDPWREIIVVRTTEDVLNVLDLSADQRQRIGAAARARVLSDHTADARAQELERAVNLTAPSACCLSSSVLQGGQ